MEAGQSLWLPCRAISCIICPWKLSVPCECFIGCCAFTLSRRFRAGMTIRRFQHNQTTQTCLGMLSPLSAARHSSPNGLAAPACSKLLGAFTNCHANWTAGLTPMYFFLHSHTLTHPLVGALPSKIGLSAPVITSKTNCWRKEHLDLHHVSFPIQQPVLAGRSSRNGCHWFPCVQSISWQSPAGNGIPFAPYSIVARPRAPVRTRPNLLIPGVICVGLTGPPVTDEGLLDEGNVYHLYALDVLCADKEYTDAVFEELTQSLPSSPAARSSDAFSASHLSRPSSSRESSSGPASRRTSDDGFDMPHEPRDSRASASRSSRAPSASRGTPPDVPVPRRMIPYGACGYIVFIIYLT